MTLPVFDGRGPKPESPPVAQPVLAQQRSVGPLVVICGIGRQGEEDALCFASALRNSMLRLGEDPPVLLSPPGPLGLDAAIVHQDGHKASRDALSGRLALAVGIEMHARFKPTVGVLITRRIPPQRWDPRARALRDQYHVRLAEPRERFSALLAGLLASQSCQAR